MIAIVSPDRADDLKAIFEENGETVVNMGSIVKGENVTYKGTLV